MGRLDQVEHEQATHPVVREALPHLDEEEEEEPCGMAEEHHRASPECHDRRRRHKACG